MSDISRPGNMWGGNTPQFYNSSGSNTTSPPYIIWTGEPDTLTGVDTSQFEPVKDENRQWRVYQVGLSLPQLDFKMFDSDKDRFMNGLSLVIQIDSSNQNKLNPFDTVFLWCPELDLLIETESRMRYDTGANPESVECYYVKHYTDSSRPQKANKFQLWNIEPIPEFTDGEEALKWMEDRT